MRSICRKLAVWAFQMIKVVIRSAWYLFRARDEMFRTFGHQCRNLGRRLPKWRAERTHYRCFATPRQPISPPISMRRCCPPCWVNDNVSADVEQVVDARGAGRYNGTEPDRAPVFVRVFTNSLMFLCRDRDGWHHDKCHSPRNGFCSGRRRSHETY